MQRNCGEKIPCVQNRFFHPTDHCRRYPHTGQYSHRGQQHLRHSVSRGIKDNPSRRGLHKYLAETSPVTARAHEHLTSRAQDPDGNQTVSLTGMHKDLPRRTHGTGQGKGFNDKDRERPDAEGIYSHSATAIRKSCLPQPPTHTHAHAHTLSSMTALHSSAKPQPHLKRNPDSRAHTGTNRINSGRKRKRTDNKSTVYLLRHTHTHTHTHTQTVNQAVKHSTAQQRACDGTARDDESNSLLAHKINIASS